MTGLLTVLQFWQTLLFGDLWSVMQSVLNVNILQFSQPLKATSLLKGRRRKENCSFACAAFTKERLWLRWSLRHRVLLSGQTERGDRKKSREQHANQNIPAEIHTPELSSLKNICVEQNLRSGWSSCSKHQFQKISVVKKP